MSVEGLRCALSLRMSATFLVEVELEVLPGTTALMGPSGAGKSTVLAAIAGLVRPDRGRIALGSEAWFDGEAKIDRAPHTRPVGFLFQSLALFPHMSALENVAYGMTGRASVSAARREAEALLVRLRVAHLASRRPGTYSGGEAQRVALARALARRPRVLLLDEPFSALDDDLRSELVRDVREALDEIAVPALVVTHREDDALALGASVVRMRAGKIER